MLTWNEIVKATAIDQATIRGVIDRLKARALVDVSPDPTDGRKLIVRAIARGEELIDQIVPFAKQVTERTYGALNPGEAKGLHSPSAHCRSAATRRKLPPKHRA